MKLRTGQIGRAHSQSLCHPDIGNLRHRKSHGIADKGVTEHRIGKAQDPVHENRIAALFKIQIPADIIHQDEIIPCNRI